MIIIFTVGEKIEEQEIARFHQYYSQDDIESTFGFGVEIGHSRTLRVPANHFDPKYLSNIPIVTLIDRIDIDQDNHSQNEFTHHMKKTFD